MRITKTGLLLAVSGLFFLSNQGASASDKKMPKQVAKLLAMTPSDFEKCTTVKDDDMEAVATLTTVSCFQETHGLLKIVWDDTFLRAFVDKKTGKTVFQIYQSLAYSGSGWRNYTSVNYESENGIQNVELTRIGNNVDCSLSRYTGCTYYETVGFDVTEKQLREIANRYEPGQLKVWKVRFKSQAGQDFDSGFVAPEVMGLLKVVDAYRAAIK